MVDAWPSIAQLQYEFHATRGIGTAMPLTLKLRRDLRCFQTVADGLLAKVPQHPSLRISHDPLVVKLAIRSTPSRVLRVQPAGSDLSVNASSLL
jgi:hypothetical protein